MKVAVRCRDAVAGLILVLVVGSCSATIDRRDGPSTVGDIERSDQGAVYVGIGDGTGRLMRIDRVQVSDIDHPGNAVMTAGAILTTLLLGALAEVMIEDPGRVQVPIATAVIAGPLGLTIGGGYFYFRSKGAAKAFEEAPTYIRVGPKKAVFEVEDFRAPPLPRPSPPDGGTDAAG
jgi:hypothetical protein